MLMFDRKPKRWICGFITALLMHGAVALAVLYEQPHQLQASAGAPAVVQLAEFISAPSHAANTPSQRSKATEAEAAPELPNEAAVLPKLIKAPPTDSSLPSLVKTKPKRKPHNKTAPKQEKTALEKQARMDQKNSEPLSDAPQQAESKASASAAHAAKTSTAKERSAADSTRISNQRAEWQGNIAAHLERHKRYPYEARQRRQEGEVLLRFTLNQHGEIVAAELVQSSGYFQLDREVKAMLRRAQPLPAPPEELLRRKLQVVVPIKFALRSGSTTD